MTDARPAVMLVILDGWGYSENTHNNAIQAAATPNWDRMLDECQHTLITCSGREVGLPAGQMGNSEVGHMHIGAGRIINQELTRIGSAIETGEFFQNTVLNEAFSRAANSGHAVHIMGLLSPGGVHSHQEHIAALIKMAADRSVPGIFVHGFLDGRDTPPQSAGESIDYISAVCDANAPARIATVIGRYFAMDRNKNWDRTALAYDLLVDGRSEFRAPSAAQALADAYARGETDEFVKPAVIDNAATPYPGIQDGDVVVFANFRSDRARQMTSAMAEPGFTGFERKRTVELGAFVSMTDYGKQFSVPIAFPTINLQDTYGEIISRNGLHQLRIAETEKYAHVTFFFNGGVEQVYPGEDRILVPSPDVATYDMQPEMSAREVTDKLVAAITSGHYDTIICNYANADMVGHTGNFAAAVRCIETLDECLGRLREACSASGMDMLITADHGNAEQMTETGMDGRDRPHTAHTSNRVPLVFCGRGATITNGGSLTDLAPTMLYLLGIDQPADMTGHSLVQLQSTSTALPGGRLANA